MNYEHDNCERDYCSTCECCCEDGEERCKTVWDDDCLEEGFEAADYQDFLGQKHKSLNLKYFKRRSKSNTSSTETCVDADGKTREVGES